MDVLTVNADGFILNTGAAGLFGTNTVHSLDGSIPAPASLAFTADALTTILAPLVLNSSSSGINTSSEVAATLFHSCVFFFLHSICTALPLPVTVSFGDSGGLLLSNTAFTAVFLLGITTVWYLSGSDAASPFM